MGLGAIHLKIPNLPHNASLYCHQKQLASDGAPRTCPAAFYLRACRLRRRRFTPSRLPARTSPRIACPPFDSADGFSSDEDLWERQ